MIDQQLQEKNVSIMKKMSDFITIMSVQDKGRGQRRTGGAEKAGAFFCAGTVPAQQKRAVCTLLLCAPQCGAAAVPVLLPCEKSVLFQKNHLKKRLTGVSYTLAYSF